mgnify:CR=1 FL=1
MAEVVPFRGLRYNLEKIPDLNLLVTPPYDVISPAEQKAFHDLNPHNMIHLELGLSDPGDNAQHNPHTRAADYLQAWQEERVLIRETEPVIYYYPLSFSLAPDVRQTRHGFICALRLEDFRSGCVRPHEKTFRAVKEERLQLMLACHADLSPIFALYDDPARVIDHHLQQGRETEPSMAFLDAQGMEHRVWRVSNPKVLRQAVDILPRRGICGLLGVVPPGTEVGLNMDLIMNGRTVRGIVAGDSVLFIDRLHEIAQ